MPKSDTNAVRRSPRHTTSSLDTMQLAAEAQFASASITPIFTSNDICSMPSCGRLALYGCPQSHCSSMLCFHHKNNSCVKCVDANREADAERKTCMKKYKMELATYEKQYPKSNFIIRNVGVLEIALLYICLAVFILICFILGASFLSYDIILLEFYKITICIATMLSAASMFCLTQPPSYPFFIHPMDKSRYPLAISMR